MLRPAYLKSESGCSDPPSAQSNAAEKSVGYTNIEKGITLLLLAKQNGEGTPSTTWVQKPADLGIFACLRTSEDMAYFVHFALIRYKLVSVRISRSPSRTP